MPKHIIVGVGEPNAHYLVVPGGVHCPQADALRAVRGVEPTGGPDGHQVVVGQADFRATRDQARTATARLGRATGPGVTVLVGASGLPGRGSAQQRHECQPSRLLGDLRRRHSRHRRGVPALSGLHTHGPTDPPLTSRHPQEGPSLTVARCRIHRCGCAESGIDRASGAALNAG